MRFTISKTEEWNFCDSRDFGNPPTDPEYLAGALSILAMIIPESAVLLFPVQVFLGSVIIMAVSRLLFMRRQDKDDHELKIVGLR